MRTITLISISRRLLINFLLCGFLVLATCVVTAGGRTADEREPDVEKVVGAATATLQREVNTLQETLELYEMKLETLQTASDQYRIQSKSAKLKLEEERKRIEILESEKLSLAKNLEIRLANALDDQKSKLEETISAEHVEANNVLREKIEDLEQELHRSERLRSMLEKNAEVKLQEQSKRNEIIEKKKLASDDKFRAEIKDLNNRLAYSEAKTKSFEESWKTAVAESEAKDELLEEESNKRIEEASRWEQRMHKFIAESEYLFADLEAKEDELAHSKRAQASLLESARENNERILSQESEIESLRSKNKNLSADLNSKVNESIRSKEAYETLFEEKDERNEALQKELAGVKQELENSIGKMEQAIEDKSKNTKAFAEALEELTSKSKGLRNELIETKFDLEASKNMTQELKRGLDELTKVHDTTLEELERSSLKFKALQTEHENLKQNYEITTGELHRNRKEKDSRNEDLQNELLQVKFELENSQNNMKQSIEDKSEMTKAYNEALEQLTSKNVVLRNELVDTKFDLEVSQNVTKETKRESAELIKAHDSTLKQLKSVYLKLNASQTEYANLKQEYEIMMGRSNESSEKVKYLLQYIEDETSKSVGIKKELKETKLQLENIQSREKKIGERKLEISLMYEEIKETLKAKETKLLETDQKHKNANNRAMLLEDDVSDLEVKIKELLEEVELQTSKNSYLQKVLLKKTYELESSQSELKQLQGRVHEVSSENNGQLLQLEIENKKFVERAEVLEQELLESTTLYMGISKELSILKDQLNTTESKATEFLHMYELVKEEKDVLGHNLRAAKLEQQEKLNALKQCKVQVHENRLATEAEHDSIGQDLLAAKLQLEEIQNAFEKCGRELRDAQSSYKIKHKSINLDLRAANLQIQEKQNVFEQCDKELHETHSDLRAANLQIQDKQKTFEQCDKELHETRSDLRAANLQIQEKQNVFEQCDKELHEKHSDLHAANLQIQEKQNVFEQCDKELHETHSMLNLANQVAFDCKQVQSSKKCDEFEQCTKELNDIRAAHSKLVRDYHESDIELQHQNDMMETKANNSKLLPQLAAANKNLEDIPETSELESISLSQESTEETSDDISETSIIQDNLNPKEDSTLNEVEKTHNDNAVSLSGLDDYTNVSTQNSVWTPLRWLKGIFSFLRWLDYALYQILRVVVDSAVFLMNILGKITSFGPIGWMQKVLSSLFVWLTSPIKTALSIVPWILNELRIIHDALVSLFEFEMTFISSLLSSEKDRAAFSFFICHSTMIVVFGEVIAALLCLDFIISSFLNPRRRRRRRLRAKTIAVPKTANASLLRKAKNI